MRARIGVEATHEPERAAGILPADVSLDIFEFGVGLIFLSLSETLSEALSE
jgi:hypothetical protein